MRPFDLGQVYSTGEAIKAQRIQNQQAPMRNAMLQQQLDNARQSGQFAQNQEQRAQTEFGQKQTAFDNKQQVENTKLLHMAMTEIASNPDAAQRYIPMLSERGIMDGSKLDFTVMTPEALQAGAREVAESTGQALRALNTAQFKSSEMTSNQKNLKTISEIRQRIAAGDPKAQQELDDFLTTIRAPYSWQNTGSQFQAAPNMPGVTTPAPIVRDLPPEKTPEYVENIESVKNKAEREGKKEADKPKAIRRIQARYDQFKNLKREVAKAKSQANFWSTGFIGQKLQDIGGTDAKALKSTLTTIKANAGFDKLQEMRDNSPTGGALGQVAVQELEALQSVWTSLEQSQDKSQLISNLNAFEAQVDSSWKRVSEAFEQDYGIPWDGNETPEKPVEYDQELLQFMTDEERALFQ